MLEMAVLDMQRHAFEEKLRARSCRFRRAMSLDMHRHAVEKQLRARNGRSRNVKTRN